MAESDTALLISTSFARGGDGSEAAGAFVADLAEELSAIMPVRAVVPGRVEGVSRVGEVEVWTFRAPDKPLSLLSPADPRNWPAIFGTLRSLRRTTIAAGADGRVAHALAFWVLPSGWAARSLKRRHGTNYSVWALGSDIWSLGRLPVVRGFLKRISLQAHAAYADGLKLGADATALTGREFAFLPSTRRLDARRDRPVASSPPWRLLFLGRWHPNKGVDLLLESLRLLKDEDWRLIAEVHIAGGGPLAELVAEAVQALQRDGRPVRLSGYLNKEGASRAFAEADRLLLPSRVESIPVVYSDAMKFRLPVVSMPVGDLPSLIGRGTGWLAGQVSAPAFAEAIAHCLRSGHDEAALAKMSERFSLRGIAEDVAGTMRTGGPKRA